MRKHSADLTMAGVLAVLGLSMAIHAVSYRILVEGGRIGPGFLPFVAGLALTAFAAWAAAETAVRARRSVADPSATQQTVARPPQALPLADAEHDQATPTRPSRAGMGALGGKVLLVFALTMGAVLLTTLTGFLVAFGLLVFVLMAAVEREPPWLALAISVAAVTVSWLVFVRLLGVPLPGGALGLLGT